MFASPFGFQRVKVIAFPVLNPERAHRFYGGTLGLLPAFEGDEQVGYFLGQTILTLKSNWPFPPTETPNPCVTIATDNARETEHALRESGITVSDPVTLCDGFYAGSFLDSEGNKLWFCSPEKRA